MGGGLTFRAEAGAGGEAGDVHDLHGELLARVPVDASPHHAEGTPGRHTHATNQLQTSDVTQKQELLSVLSVGGWPRSEAAVWELQSGAVQSSCRALK